MPKSPIKIRPETWKQDTAEFIKTLEGFTAKASWDFKQSSNGYGTVEVVRGEVLTPAVAHNRLMSELQSRFNLVDKLNVSFNAKAALVSFGFNVGNSPLKLLVSDIVVGKQLADIATRMKLYNKAGGLTNKGLVNRREKEAQLLLTP